MLRGFTQESPVQTFEIYLAPKVRMRYDQAFVGTLETPRPRGRAGRRADGADANSRRRGFRAAPEEGVQRQKELNSFLMGYLGTGSGAGTGRGAEGRTEVRPKRFFERLIGMAPEINTYDRDKSTFLEDTSGRFKRLLLAGREFDMVMLGVLTYALLDTLTANTFVAIFATYAMDVTVRFVRKELATRNIALKTLLDDRFLL